MSSANRHPWHHMEACIKQLVAIQLDQGLGLGLCNLVARQRGKLVTVFPCVD
jgi:hypothetical protein